MSDIFRKVAEYLTSNPITVSFVRLIQSYVYNKESFLLKKSTHVFSDIYNTDFWNSKESKSGGGSTLEATKVIREQLPSIISQFSIKSMLDVPCGDYNWMRNVNRECNYIGGDIVKEIIERNNKLYSSDKIKFVQIDLTSDELPEVDLVFCKDCLQHLSNESIKKALNNIKRSGSKYLLVTSYSKTWKNHDIYDGDYRPLNLSIKPFCLPRSILQVKENSRAKGVEVDKAMYLFSLNSINLF